MRLCRSEACLTNLMSTVLFTKCAHSIFRVDREASNDTKIKDVDIPKGMLVSIPIYALHHNPKIWPEPEKFNPYRFLPEEKAKHNTYDWIPFGAGPRNCLAMRLALTEVKIATVYLMRKYKFLRTEETEVSIIYENRNLG